MSTPLGRRAVRHPPLLDPAPAAPEQAGTCLLRPSQAQARDVSRSMPSWLERVRDSGARRVVIDMSQVHRLDLSGFGMLLAKLRDFLQVTVVVTGVGVSEAVSLRSMGLLDGITVQRRAA